ncbi:MAG: pilus assembly protein N-terminal domain-containing protein, partial [Armatimonadota bacterium]|nr:pilus assembly protein N-terminal domain-containing protein [Armatimonadota bacterium]
LLGVCCLATLNGLAVPSLAEANTIAVTAPDTSTVGNGSENRAVTTNLTLGKVRRLPFPRGASYRLSAGQDLVRVEEVEDTLLITPLKPGRASLTIDAPESDPVSFDLRIGGAGANAPDVAPQSTPPTNEVTTAVAQSSTATPAPAASTVTTAPAAMTPVLTTLPPLQSAPIQTVPSGLQPLEPSAKLTPALRLPASLPHNSFALPSPAQRQIVDQSRSRNTINVTQGLARLIQFPSNILSVYFSDANVMDARAINARTLAITGVAAGKSTLAIFTARSPNDAIGQANVYQVEVGPPTVTPSGAGAQAAVPAEEVATAVRAALDDPRFGVNVVQLPSGGLLVRLTGTVRNEAEAREAAETARLFHPQITSAIYVDPSALTRSQARDSLTGGGIAAVPSAQVPTPDEMAEANLRQITGNQTVRLVPLGQGYVLQAEVLSPLEADTLMRLAANLGRNVTPLIVVRGAPGFFAAARPVRTDEDEDMTRRLQEVTGIGTVYAVKAAQNSIAIYGTVRNRSDYDAVRRYASLLPQLAAGAGAGAGGQAPVPANAQVTNLQPASAPATGLSFPIQIQMFVRILDPAAAQVRQVTVETNVVEIARNSLKHLGAEFGSATLLSQTITAPTTTVVPGTPPTVITNPGTINRTIDPTFRPGTVLGGNGFAGGGPTRILDPLRVRLNALYQSGNVNVLSAPNLTVTEGNDASILIGGQRPVPDVTTTTGAGGGAVNQRFTFRPFGIILRVRPTIAADDTIFMQIRADVTELDFATGVSFQGSVVPGERVRSVETTLTVREGDTFVMGGLMTNDRREQTTRVPLLSRIPILGALFRSRRFENNESELAIFMQPRLSRLPVADETFAVVPGIPAWPRLPIEQAVNPILAIGTGTTGGAGR